ncbi:HD domain-containing protein [Alicyclobacillus sp. SO9]|uniref:HD domain-containing protein n=1 Tax=Alicyclobacillus sp. SO9 TaxID=2665646 RepID=UPI0018E809A0|nr:HD domain-containing protein [Alicyclobacillus sp. SO9]QQE77083.1 HD domain-containing protein [Alicyclobacillus sp. SO9]
MKYEELLLVARERSSDDAAHDFLHVERVLKNAQSIMEEVPADADVVIPAVLLHELFNYPKGHPLSHLSGDICAEHASEVLDRFDSPGSKREKVLDSIRFHSFSRGVVPDHIEGKVLQDADRLDALGAIGIARLFATCQQMKTPFYDLADPFAQNREPDDKKYGIDHVYIKLFRLTDSMHTRVAREMAMRRTQFIKEYIQQLRLEIE